jgi:DNA-binding NarL/FixJ family response regulator
LDIGQAECFLLSVFSFREGVAAIAVSNLNSPIRIGIVDDHPVFRAGLKRVLERSGDMTVEWDLADSAGLAALFIANPVDVLLMDVELKAGPDGLATTRTAAAKWPNLNVIVLSGSLDPDMPRLAQGHGAAGFLAKDMPIPDMVAKIREVALAGRRRSPRSPRDPSRLSVRENQVLQEIRRGRTNREIAASLGISITTVNKHVQGVLKKLNVRNRAQAAASQG